MDGINYPICTEGTANCLSKAVYLGLCSRADIKRATVVVIIDRPANCNTPVFKVMVAKENTFLSKCISTYL